MLLFTGTSHPQLAQEVAAALGISLGACNLGRFPDGEVSFQVLESVRGQDVFILQSLALDPDHYLVELLIMIDALKRASAKNIIPVITYYGYGRQDRKDLPREPIAAKLVADMLTVAGATQVLAMDLHAGQLEGFFNIPVDHIHAMPLIAQQAKILIGDAPFVVVAPDVGSVKLVHSYASYLNTNFVIVVKQRNSVTEVSTRAFIGDVAEKDVLLADDMCSTAGTLVSAAKACREKGARRIFAAVTHGIFVGDAVKKIEKSPIEALLMSNTIPNTDRLAGTNKIRVVSVASTFAHAIRCIVCQESLSSPEK